MHIYYEVTNRCNLKCEYCYNNSGKEKHSELKTEEIFRIIDYMKVELSLTSITLSGGEPLMRSDLFHLIDYCRGKGICVYLITNGTLITQNIDYEFENLKHIIISLHNNYNNIDFETIKTLRNKVKMNFSVVLNKDNYDSIDKYCKFAAEMRIPISFKVQKARGRGNNEKLLNLAEIEIADGLIQKNAASPFLRTKRLMDLHFFSCCYFSKEYDEYTMLPNGDIYLCQVLPRKYKVGNALDQTWKNNVELVKNELYNDWMKYKRNICNSCYAREVCRGICPGEIVSETEKCLQCDARCKLYLKKSLGNFYG